MCIHNKCGGEYMDTRVTLERQREGEPGFDIHVNYSVDT